MPYFTYLFQFTYHRMVIHS